MFLSCRQSVSIERYDAVYCLRRSEVVVLKYVTTLNGFMFLYNTVAEVLVYKANGCYSAIL